MAQLYVRATSRKPQCETAQAYLVRAFELVQDDNHESVRDIVILLDDELTKLDRTKSGGRGA